MISLALAQELKEAGLVWQTTINDFFAVPDRGMDDKLFVISDLMVTMELLQGWPALTFHGTAEWAADYLFTHDAVWMPTEEQLRQELLAVLGQNGRNDFQLTYESGQYTLHCQARSFRVSGLQADEVYAKALLHYLQATAETEF